MSWVSFTVIASASVFCLARCLIGELNLSPASPILGARPIADDGPDPDRIAPPTGMQWVITLSLLAASLFIILSRGYDGGAEKWAFGMTGTLVGYWLRPLPTIRERDYRLQQKKASSRKPLQPKQRKDNAR